MRYDIPIAILQGELAAGFELAESEEQVKAALLLLLAAQEEGDK